MNKKYILITIIFLLIESFFASNLSANPAILGIKDNNELDLFQTDTNFGNKSILNPVNTYYSCSTTNDNSTFEYVIITSRDYVNSSFQVLIAHKSQYMTATIVTKEDILLNPSFWVNGTYGDATNNSNGNPYIENGAEVTANYSRFNDTTAKIRNFIRFSHQKWKTEYVLIGGDVEIIPVREFYVNISGWDIGFVINRSIQGWIPSDLYYGNLDGTWNADFDENFGERGTTSIKEEADLFSEVFIGRAPIENKNDIATFVHKVITFETTDKPKDILLHQSNLSPSDMPDTSIIPEECTKYIPDSYMIHKLYQKNEVITKDKWVSAFKDPDKLIVLHIGNGFFYGPSNSWYQLYYIARQKLKFYNYDVGRLNNTFFPIHISISCLTGNFEKTDCLAEELLLWANGGPSACIFNSEVGCVKNDNALAYSGEYIVRLFYEFFVNETGNLGKINQFSKEFFANRSCVDPNYRWVLYETNLLGDPETPVFETRVKLPTRIIYVDDDFNSSTQDWNITRFNKIQNGIDASFDEGTIYVYNGTYLENVIIDKTIKLEGESKYSTIIDGGDINNTIILKSNASTLTNFTIQHSNSDKDKKYFIGIYIPLNCWGNIIFNNIITENNGCGIVVNNSCRIIITNNIITLNGEGICLTKNISSTYNPPIYITCSSIIQYNTISSNEQYGIYIQEHLNNYICNNNFINNNGGSGRDAYFLLSKKNEWNGNYWNEPRTTPKIIWGIYGPIFPYLLDFSDGIIFPHINYLPVLNVGFPKPDIDKNPAQKPYDIT